MRPEDFDVLVGRLAVERGLLTDAQLREALEDRSRSGAPLGDFLIARGLITPAQVEMLRAEPRVLGKYELRRELGSGGMGVVYEAVDTVLRRRVALKTLTPSTGQDAREAAREQERFLREARLAGGLPKHPNIVGIYEAGVADGRPYLAMELIEGLHFGQWRAVSRADARAQVTLLRDVARAVHFAHEHGVLHRDLKPQNILVDAAERPHVGDFGLAKPLAKEITDSLTTSGVVVGTPAYMSPEQALGLKTLDRRSDVYSLGVLLFEVLTDRTPFTAATAVETLVKVIDHAVPSASELCAQRGLPPPDPVLEAICARALAKKPEERTSTAQDFAEELDRWLSRSGRRRWLAGAAAAGALALGGGAFWALGRSTPPREATLAGHEGAVNALAFSSDGAWLLSGGGDGVARLWDVESARPLRVFGPLSAKIEAVAFSPDGRHVAAVTEPKEGGGELAIWPVGGGEPRILKGHERGVNALAWSAAGLATGEQNGIVRIWDVESGTPARSWKAHEKAVRGAAFGAGGLATASWDRTAALWDPASGARRARFEGHTDGVWGVAVSGSRVASASSDKTLRVWDAEGRGLHVLRGHADVVVSVALSGDLVASGSWDRTARLWDLRDGRELKVFRGHADSVWRVAFSPDARRLATASLDRTIRLWPL